VGAAFYNPPVEQFGAAWRGRYFYGDFCGGFIRYLNPGANPPYTTSSNFATNVDFLVDLAVSPSGHLYYLARGQQGTGSDGQVWKVRSTTACVPVSITQQPQPVDVPPGQQVTFTVVAAGTSPSFQWQRAAPGTTNFIDIPGATGSSHTRTAQLSDNGSQFRVRVSNTCPSSVTSIAVPLTVRVGITAQITQPVAGGKFRGGQTITFLGVARNATGGELPASTMTWKVDLHHGTLHTHPVLLPTTGITTGNFLVEPRGHPESNIFYRVHLDVAAIG